MSRLLCKGEPGGFEMEMELDVHSDLLPVAEGERLKVQLVTTLNADGSADAPSFDAALLDSKSGPLSEADYCMHGTVFKYTDPSAGRVSLLVSFGGLLMKLTGDPANINGAELDMDLYLLLKKIAA